jgi:hypothetical protein
MLRKVVTIGFSLLSFQSVACPNLAGVYKNCQANAEEVESLTVKQNGNKFSFITDAGTRSEEVRDIIADGKIRTGEYESQEIFACSDNKLVGIIRAELFGTPLDITQTFYKEGKKIIIDISSDDGLGNQIICE